MDFPHGAPAITRRKIHFANPQGVAIKLISYQTLVPALTVAKDLNNVQSWK